MQLPDIDKDHPDADCYGIKFFFGKLDFCGFNEISAVILENSLNLLNHTITVQRSCTRIIRDIKPDYKLCLKCKKIKNVLRM